MLYRGGCHCGSVAFAIEGEVEAAVACNCSICARKGALLWSAPWNRLRMLTSGTALTRTDNPDFHVAAGPREVG